MLFVQGTQGCKNIKLGGDTVHGESSEGWNVFMTYFVYRSLKFPPGDKRQQWNLVYIKWPIHIVGICWQSELAQPNRGFRLQKKWFTCAAWIFELGESVIWTCQLAVASALSTTANPTQSIYILILYINRSIQKAFPVSLYRYTSI